MIEKTLWLISRRTCFLCSRRKRMPAQPMTLALPGIRGQADARAGRVKSAPAHRVAIGIQLSQGSRQGLSFRMIASERCERLCFVLHLPQTLLNGRDEQGLGADLHKM